MAVKVLALGVTLAQRHCIVCMYIIMTQAKLNVNQNLHFLAYLTVDLSQEDKYNIS